MVLGLIDFLLGGKKKTKIPKNAQVAATPMNNVGENAQVDGATVPDGQNATTENASNANVQQNANAGNTGVASGGKKSISEVISSINQELKSTSETVSNIASEIKDIQNSVNSLDKRVNEIESKNTELNEKVVDIDDNMSKFLSLYELVNDQYNPFVESKAKTVQGVQNMSSAENSVISAKEVVVGANGETETVETTEDGNGEIRSFDVTSPEAMGVSQTVSPVRNENLEHSLLELDTLDIEEAAADAVPLTRLKNNTNSLVIILSWLEYLAKKVGVEESKNTLRYYTETLKWITPEVYFELEKYLRGMSDLKDEVQGQSLTVRDHIVSLYFISKLNEKVLDERLTKAVLQIIKQ